MNEPASLKIKGLAKLQRALRDFPKLVNRQMRTSMKGAIEQITEDIKQYPPLTEANQPRAFNSVYSISTGRPNNTWYERGEGPKRIRKDGSVVSSGGSEVLGRSWTTRVVGVATEIRGIAGTSASYARPVQDETEQAGFHGARGWPTVQGVLRKRGPWVQRFFGNQIQKILNAIARRSK